MSRCQLDFGLTGMAFLAFAVNLPAQPAPEIPVGVPIPKVVCQDQPAMSYALYLPSNFTRDRKWPTLFCLDPRGRGMIPLELFREAAERLGFIIASSNDYFSDQPVEPSWPAIQATWNDVTGRFPVDQRRLYVAGFSGGARMAWTLAETSPVPLAGIIGVGAGLARPDIDAVDFSRLAFHGMVGVTDFNYYEMLDLDALLEDTPIPHHLLVFEDRHNWSGPGDAARALEWMQVEAMRRDAVERDPEFLKRYFGQRMKRVADQEKQGDFISAHDEVCDAIRQADGLASLPDAVAVRSRLESSKGLSRQRKRRNSARREHDKALAQANAALKALRSTELFRPGLNQLIADSGLIRLLKGRENKDRERALAARRALESLLVDCSFYIARGLRKLGDHKRLQVSLSFALKIAPETGWIWWRLAGAYALDGQSEKALGALENAVMYGFRRADLLSQDPDLASLRPNPKFQEILQACRATADSKP